MSIHVPTPNLGVSHQSIVIDPPPVLCQHTYTHTLTNSQKNSLSRPPPMLYVRGHELVQLAMRPQSTLGNCSDSRSGISCGLLIEYCAAA